MTRRVLVTGASGFLGQATGLGFARLGYEVTASARSVSDADMLRRGGVARILDGDLRLDRLIQDAGHSDLVVHCAGGGSVARAARQPLLDLEDSVGSLSVVLEYVRKSCPQAKVIFPSSAAVYGQADELPTPETARAKPMSAYGFHKLMAEELCQSYSVNFGLSVLIIRFFSLYGPGLRKQLLWDACNKLVSGNHDFLGTGEERRDWLHVDDAVRLIQVAAAKGRSGQVEIVNGGGGDSIEVQHAINALAVGLRLDSVPHFLGVPDTGNPTAYCADISQARAWGWEPTIAFEDGIRRYATWFLENRP